MAKLTQAVDVPRPRMLIRSVNWIGDAVLSVAAIRELRRLFPGHHLTLASRPWVAGLFEEQELVDEVVELPSGGWLEELRFVRGRFSGFDKAVIFPNSFLSALGVCGARIPDRAGYVRDARGFLLTRRARPRVKELQRHQVFYYLDLLFQSGLSPVDYMQDPAFQPQIRLQLPESGHRRASVLLESEGIDSGRPLVVINPGAYFGPAKRWFTNRYAEVADRLIKLGEAEIVIVGTADESRIAGEIASMMTHHPRLLSGKTDLPALMGVIAASRLFITNDSGPMHLAAALGVRQLALFGSTDEKATGPFSQNAEVIHKHVPCSPCLLRECPIDLRCFDRISVEEVTQRALQMLDNG